MNENRPELPKGSILPSQLNQADLERVPRLVLEDVSVTPNGDLRKRAFHVRGRPPLLAPLFLSGPVRDSCCLFPNLTDQH